MWIVCLAEDLHAMSNLIFSYFLWNIKKTSSTAVVIDMLRVKVKGYTSKGDHLDLNNICLPFKRILLWKEKFTTLEPLYKTVYYKMVSDIGWFNGGPQKCIIQTKMYRLYRNMTNNVHLSI